MKKISGFDGSKDLTIRKTLVAIRWNCLIPNGKRRESASSSKKHPPTTVMNSSAQSLSKSSGGADCPSNQCSSEGNGCNRKKGTERRDSVPLGLKMRSNAHLIIITKRGWAVISLTS